MPLPLALVPAYGRKYTSALAAEADWLAGKDFKILDGPYCSVRDIEAINARHGGANIYWAYPEGVSFPARAEASQHERDETE